MNSETDSIITHYNRYSSTYDQNNEKESQKAIDKLALDLIKEYAQGKDVLEVGCGTGIWMQFLRTVVKSIQGVDISSGMVKQAKKKGLSADVGSAEKLPFQDQSFDFIFSYRVLPHVLNLSKALQEIKRLLRDDGKAIIMFYNKNSLKCISRKQKMEQKVYTQFYRIKDIQALEPSAVFLLGTKIFPYPKFISKSAFLTKTYFAAERAASKTGLGRFGGNILLEVRK